MKSFFLILAIMTGAYASELENELKSFEKQQPKMVQAYRIFRNLAKSESNVPEIKKTALKNYFKNLRALADKYKEQGQYLTPYFGLEPLVDQGKFEQFVTDLDATTLKTIKNLKK
ncbi:MAG: hypothetical protein JNM93_05115 [Bacteriovoracaceae bacterium]|nr:hypothetical protein [Bacteriovoracaceae bacterium]